MSLWDIFRTPKQEPFKKGGELTEDQLIKVKV